MFSSPDHRQETGATADLHQAQSIGQPIHFASGQFVGQTIRAELEELQKAESGRKYARVDRRPLDPPPAILLRLFQVDPNGGWERELAYDEIVNVGIMCTVDLFPVPDPSQEAEVASYAPCRMYNTVDFKQATSPLLTYFPLHPFTTPHEGLDSPVIPFQIPRRQPILAHVSPNEILSDAVQHIGNHLITESSKLTPALVGEKFVEPTLVDYHNKMALIFVFGDLAVQREGRFIFRYRVFDIFSVAHGNQNRPMLAELYGGAFRVYSTREFPGLLPSTPLTRSLSKYGVRVALRDAERRSRKRGGGGERRGSTHSNTSHSSGSGMSAAS